MMVKVAAISSCHEAIPSLPGEVASISADGTDGTTSLTLLAGFIYKIQGL